jgi:hypothetical protein
MRGWRIRLIAAISLVGLALAGCGGDDGDDGGGDADGGGGALTQQEFVAKADAICRKGNKKEEAFDLGGPGWYLDKPFQDAELMTRFGAVGRETLDELKKLEPPEESRAAFADAVAAMDRIVGAIERQVEGLEAGKKGITPKNSQDYDRGYSDLAVAAAAAGMTECVGIGV